jgi:inner membrane protein
MLIAHLPAGYLLTKFIQKVTGTKRYMRLGLIASVLPDIDMLYFNFVSSNKSHHEFITHIPMFWFLVMFFSVGLASTFIKNERKYNRALLVLFIFFANIFLHMLLDSFAAPIRWVYPFYNYSFELIHVPAKYDWWVWSFVLHWSFLAEVGIIILALSVFFKVNQLKIIIVKPCPIKS